MESSRRIRQNIWGNWVGYVGRKRAYEFGTDEIAAGHWLLTGSTDFNAGYAPENFDAAKKAARSAI